MMQFLHSTSLQENMWTQHEKDMHDIASRIDIGIKDALAKQQKIIDEYTAWN
jgi:hypothetical protein